jgi:hypothetical protein
MRTLTVKCDVCQGDVTEGGSFSLALKDAGVLRKDVCSIVCLHVALTGIVLDLEKEYPEEVTRSRAQTQYGPTSRSQRGTRSASPSGLEVRAVQEFPQLLAAALRARGVQEAEFAGWTRLQKDVAQAWLDRGAKLEERPDFLPGCSACDAGVPCDDDNAYKHTGQGRCFYTPYNFEAMRCVKSPAATPEPLAAMPEPPADTAERLLSFSPEYLAASNCTCATTKHWVVEGDEAACTACFKEDGSAGYWKVPAPPPAPTPTASERRGRGRPKGSKNKKGKKGEVRT